MIYTASSRERPTRLSADVCVIGTGAGGATVAALLAERGARVVALEAGPYLTPLDFTQREGEMLGRLFADLGSTTDEAAFVRVLHGRCVGGSTVHNTNLVKRAPAAVLAEWREHAGTTELTDERMAALYDEVEAALSVSPMTDAMVNANNRVLARGAAALGYATERLAHNRRGCWESGFCTLGCSFDAKENALKVMVPRAVRAGATVVADCAVDALEVEAGRIRRARAGGLVVEAEVFCLAAGALDTPVLLHRSGVPDPHGVVGRHLHLHPGVAVAGVMDRVIQGWIGIPQSIECTQFLGDRVWIVPAFAHPIAAATMLPGFGENHASRMELYPRLAVLTPMIHDLGEGRVDDDDGHPRIHYSLTSEDRSALALGIRECARLLFAAGARQVLAPFHVPKVLVRPDDIETIRAEDLRPRRLTLTAVHPMGTARMGANPESSVVDPGGRHHQLPNLFVADASLFPGPVGGPPQLTVFALATHVARSIAAGMGG